jgi:hypothetical protein
LFCTGGYTEWVLNPVLYTPSCSYREDMPLELEPIDHSGICEHMLLPCSQPKISQNDKKILYGKKIIITSYGPKTIYPFSKFIRWEV